MELAHSTVTMHSLNGHIAKERPIGRLPVILDSCLHVSLRGVRHLLNTSVKQVSVHLSTMEKL